MTSNAAASIRKTESSNDDRPQPLRAGINIFAADAVSSPSLPPEADKADANALQALLRERIETDKPAEADDGPEAGEQTAPPTPSRLRARMVKSALGLALIVIVGWMPAQRLFQVQSVEAVVNAPLVTVRAPISGVLEAGADGLTVGQPVEAGRLLADLSNPRADRGRLDTAIMELDGAREERDAVAAEIETLKSLRSGLATQLDAFRENRLRQLDAYIAEAGARIAGAEATVANATTVRARHETLAEGGFASDRDLDAVLRDAAVAAAAADEARAARAALIVERDALKSGVFLGDSYNDQPRSAQRLDEIDQQIATLSAKLSRQEARIASAETAVTRENEAFNLVRSAELDAPVGGRVWEIFTAPGEQVVAGQPLFSLLNCAQPIVTAVVTEAVYNSLSVGMPAQFIYREGGVPLPGHVVQLTGAGTATSSFAITAAALKKETYRVAVAFNDTSGQGGCAIGRTGRVVFGKADG